jgi:opacity protein-like surface antigen
MAFGLILLLSGSAFGQGRNLSLQVQAGFGFPEEGTFRGGVETGFGFALPLVERLSLSAEFLRWNVTSKQAYGKFYNGTVTVSPILVSLQYEFARNNYFVPYALIGLGYVYAQFKIGSYVSIPEVRIEQRIEKGVAPYLGLGARVAFGPSVSFFCEAAYLRRQGPATTITHDMNLGDSVDQITANLRHVFLKFGLKLFF